MLFSGVFMITLAVVSADMYMHNPRGSNDRLNGRNRNRANGNRLFDSQNNNRGGYNVGRDPVGDITSGIMKYYVGSTLPIEWTNQHECGGDKTDCDIIIQYMCDDVANEKGLRDGLITNTIPANVEYHCDEETPALQGSRCNQASIKRYGMQETQLHYARCKTRERNKGLYTADQNLRGTSAIYTRQNPQGTRRGLECPEERDYYPYDRPTPWIDIAILTNNLAKCAKDAAESQNVKAKSECRLPNERASLTALQNRRDKRHHTPLTKAACEGKTYQSQAYTWDTVSAHNETYKKRYPNSNLAEPKCAKPPLSRDNHLGNGERDAGNADKVPQQNVYNWVIPNTPGTNCVLRLRYNISIGDYEPQKTTAVNDNAKSDECFPRIDIGSDYGIDAIDSNTRGYKIENNPQLKPLKTEGNEEVGQRLTLQLAINTAQTGRTFQDRSHKFSILPRKTGIPADAEIVNVGVSGKRGNIVQVYPATEYQYTPNDLKVDQGTYIHFQWTGSLRNPNNNDGEGKKGTDKNNIISMANKTYGGSQLGDVNGNYGNSYPANINTARVINMTLAKAKRGALPYLPKKTKRDEIEEIDDVEEDTDISDDSDEEDTNISDDRDEETEIENLLTKDVSWIEQVVNDDYKNDYEDEEDTMVLEDPEASPASSRRRRRRWSRRRRRSVRRRAAKVDGLLNKSSAYVNLGPIKTDLCAVFHYMCTRNNNFSNRSQKGEIEVKCPPTTAGK